MRTALKFDLSRRKTKNISIFTQKIKGGRILQVCPRRQDRETRVKTAKGSEDLTRSLAESHPCCNSHAHYKMFQKLVDVVLNEKFLRWSHSVSGLFLDLHIGRSQWCFLVRRLSIFLELSIGAETSSRQLSYLVIIVITFSVI